MSAGLAAGATAARGRGWFVFPVGRDPATGENKRPLVKWRDWTVSEGRADELFGVWQRKDRVTGYGIDCGRSGLVVLDEDAAEALAALCTANKWDPLPPTFTVATARGRHFYYLAPADGREVRNHVKADGAEVDIRGSGGYVVGPDSLHASGARYAVEDGRNPVPVPDWFVDRFGSQAKCSGEASTAPSAYGSETSPRGRATLEEARANIEAATTGTRNDTLNTQAFIVASEVKGGLIEPDEAEATLLAAASACGLFDDEARKTIRSAFDAARPNGPNVWFDALPDDVESEPKEVSGNPPLVDDQKFQRAVEAEVYNREVRDAATERIRQQRYAASAALMPALVPLDRVLALPRTAPKFLIEGLWPYDGTSLHIAQRKTGKTALTMNLTRALVDGDPFLGAFACAGGERVALVNLEDPENALADLLERQRIADPASVLPISLNGNARAFDVVSDKGRARWAAALADAGVTVLMVDPLKPLVDAFGLDEWRQTGELFNAIKACAHEAGIRHVHVSHHAGHALEGGRVRARGDSSLEGTADALWFSAMGDPTDAGSVRQFSALGRGVAVEKGALLLDPATGRQTYTTKAAGLVIVKRDAVVEHLTFNGSTSRQDLIANVRGIDKNNAASVLGALVASGDVVESAVGSQHAKHYSLAPSPDDMFPDTDNDADADNETCEARGAAEQ